MITTKNIDTDVLGDALKSGPQASTQQTRGIYVRNTTLSLSDKLTLEHVARQAEEKRQYDADVASGKIKLDLEGRQIVAPEGPKLSYVNEGRDPLGELVYGKR